MDQRCGVNIWCGDHVFPLLGKHRERSSYTTAVTE
jgi:hypothetical protein